MSFRFAPNLRRYGVTVALRALPWIIYVRRIPLHTTRQAGNGGAGQ